LVWIGSQNRLVGWYTRLTNAIQKAMAAISSSQSKPQPKIIVLDDDPTGSQTVHSCLLLTQWDVATLRIGLADASPIMFVLTNTRSLTPEDATKVTREVCRNLKPALEAENIHEFMIVSRSDSTLRGHYPIETDAIAEELGDFDAHFLVPAFFEGGRFTESSVHYLVSMAYPHQYMKPNLLRIRFLVIPIAICLIMSKKKLRAEFPPQMCSVSC